MNARTIRLRRPVTLSIQDGVFVPQSGLMVQVDRRWSDLCADNPEYYDGRLYHVLGVHRNGHGGATLHVIDCAYRFFAVQDQQFDLGVRALGVKGIAMRDGLILMGQRSESVAAYRGMWEFAPAGSVEPGREPAEVIRAELMEETGLGLVSEPQSIAALFDPVLRCWELVFRLQPCEGAAAARPTEYTHLEWRSPDDLPSPGQLSPVARQITALL